jgi:hypothetical protein
MEVLMASGRYPFWTHDTVAAAVLAGVGMASLQSKLDGVASELNLPAVTALVRGWPMVALFAALILLVVHSVGQAERCGNEMKDGMTNKGEIARLPELDEAVGEGLEPVEEDEPATARMWAVGKAKPLSARVSQEDAEAALVDPVESRHEENHARYASSW